ncbi:MAG: ATPase, partial [Thermoanaerobaculia bacterium]|nr:ATPase [Thermoanaerobaculia bacterium]
PGTPGRPAFLCRHTPARMEFRRPRGATPAAAAALASPEEAREFAARVGFPIILKPRDGAGAAGTERIGDAGQLERAIRAYGLDRGASLAAEEFIEGHEGFYDTLTVGGEVACEFFSHYYPGVLEAMRERWISPYVITTNRGGEQSYDEAREMGRRVIRELGIGTSATHMEWFFGPKGLKFAEIGCRPPGVMVWDLYCAANDFDLYRAWGHAIVHGRVDQRPSRRFSAAMIALRPNRDGRIAGYQGLDEIQGRHGEWILDSHLPPPGSPTQPIEAGYMANAWIRLRHPDYDTLRGICDDIGRTVRVLAG